MIAGRPAAARLRRMRWALTLLYATVSAVSLVTLVMIAASIDARSGSRDLDSEIRGRAEALSRAIWMDKGTLHLEPLAEDELATASDVTAVLQKTGTADARAGWLHPRRDGALPPAGRLDDLWAATLREQEPVLATIPAPDGRELRWATAPVWDTDEIGAVVLVAADPASVRRRHTELVLWLAAGCAVLVLTSAGAGHLLSGKSMRPALGALDRQEQFLAEAAHELRTPLATLRLAVEDDSGRDAVRQVDHLDRLVTGLLARARIDTGIRPLELTPLRLDLVVEQVVQELPYDDGRVSLRTEPTVVLGDPDLLAQAVRNLVGNALRHGAPAPVEVSVAAGRVAVRDHGPGIPARDRERVFGDRVTDGRGGIGVGLAIVRWVAELHGGRAHVAPAPGPGTLVELILPRFIVRS
ncbi:HAMP domain-containing histidine kinase [Couchioplanes caeruleus]|uniref:sensor histidine kinase n=1 Tax=Couchioplanes caeruleus TaxID=56438 RepID=UPI0020BE81AE|nr:HAMP domain-containing sensor histidine kinase [Couchioplanes caeruleus]UQU62780.1 HAMP domain-containing histidine kinase [Couchioplanes caeruleus]